MGFLALSRYRIFQLLYICLFLLYMPVRWDRKQGPFICRKEEWKIYRALATRSTLCTTSLINPQSTPRGCSVTQYLRKASRRLKPHRQQVVGWGYEPRCLRLQSTDPFFIQDIFLKWVVQATLNLTLMTSKEEKIPWPLALNIFIQ